ncbi:MAG: hypothetical protein WCT26_04420 [Candidatus Buchananbacteria bacterium]|jgi:hypothetical protein
MTTKILSILNIVILCLIVFVVSVFFVENAQLIGFILVGLSVLCIVSLIPFGIKVKSIQPDIMFGIIDNGILAIMAIVGGHFAGVAGAIIGGVVGNAITDAIAGIFEGYSAEKLRTNNINEERTIIKSAVGKMAGCLLGAGVVLIFSGLMRF